MLSSDQFLEDRGIMKMDHSFTDVAKFFEDCKLAISKEWMCSEFENSIYYVA